MSILPTSPYADDPVRWLVVYNTADDDSVMWAQEYGDLRGIPEVNRVGLSLPLSEKITEAEFLAMREAVRSYMADNGLTLTILGILLGHGVPAMYTRSGDGRAESIAGQLHFIDDGTDAIANPLAPGEGEPLVRPKWANLAGMRLTARIDGAALNDSRAIVNRATTIMDQWITGHIDDATIWLDPFGPDGEEFVDATAEMAAWGRGIDRQMLRLPLRLSAVSGGGGDPQFASIDRDGFFWGWQQATPPEGFFGTPAGQRVFCFQLGPGAATCPSLRSSGDSWGIGALSAGYAAVAGSSREYAAASVPRVGPFFEALRRGWTLAEAWFVACPVLRDGLVLVGDPLMSVRLPRGGWNLYGPLTSWEAADFATPAIALRESERSAMIDTDLRPAEGNRGVYVLRHVDDAGREASASNAVAVQVVEGMAIGATWAPSWPSAAAWTAAQRGGAWAIVAHWGARFDELGIATVELVEQVWGEDAGVVSSIVVRGGDSRVMWERTPAGSTVRYLIRATAPGGATAESPWSAWVTLMPDESRTLQLV